MNRGGVGVVGGARAIALSGAAIAALALWPTAAGAANINVTTTADESTNNTTCSLREAVKSANDNSNTHEDTCTAGQSGSNVDFVNLAADTYTLSGAAGDDANASGDLDIITAGPITIDGVIDANEVPLSIIDANSVDRLIDVQPDVVGTTVVTVREVVLQNGNVPGGSSDGGAIRIGDDDSQFLLQAAKILGSDAGRYGGAVSIDNAIDGVDVEIEQTEFSGNTAGDDGGALYVDVPQNYQVDVETSAFVGNSSAAMGGAAYIESGSPGFDQPVLTFTNSTLSGNSAATGGGAVAFDFGEFGTVWFRFSTITGNTTPAGGAGGGVFTDNAGQFVLFQGGTIVSGNTAAGAPSNCAGPGDFQSLGYNLEATNSCGLDQSTDLVNTNPLLAPLGLNTGGTLTTRTHGLYNESQAVNRIPALSCSGVTIDQRGVGRPVGGSCDVGAFEGTVGPAPASPGATPATPAVAKKCKKKKKKKKGKSLAGAAKKKKGCKKKKKKKK